MAQLHIRSFLIKHPPSINWLDAGIDNPITNNEQSSFRKIRTENTPTVYQLLTDN